MKPFIESIRDIESSQEQLRKRPYGVIEVAKGRFVRVQLRPWPKYGSLWEVHWWQAMKSKRHEMDVCRLYYNQPLGHRNYLTLSYVESSLNTQLRTFYKALDVLTHIAFIKRSDAILAEVTNNKFRTDSWLVAGGSDTGKEALNAIGSSDFMAVILNRRNPLRVRLSAQVPFEFQPAKRGLSASCCRF